MGLRGIFAVLIIPRNRHYVTNRYPSLRLSVSNPSKVYAFHQNHRAHASYENEVSIYFKRLSGLRECQIIAMYSFQALILDVAIHKPGAKGDKESRYFLTQA